MAVRVDVKPPISRLQARLKGKARVSIYLCGYTLSPDQIGGVLNVLVQQRSTLASAGRATMSESRGARDQ